MTAIALLLTIAGLIGVVTTKNLADMRRRRLATIRTSAAEQPVDRIR